MTVSIASKYTQRPNYWTTFKAFAASKRFMMQYDDDGVVYTIWGYDGPEVHLTTIWKGPVPDGVIAGGYSQVQNDADKSDFETNYKTAANAMLSPLVFPDYDVTISRRFGNATFASGSEALVYNRTYAAPASQAQRVVVSTSVQDAGGGSGAVKIRLTYLNSDYVLKTEDITLNGTSEVTTVATDIRFVEDMQVIQGAACVGAVKLLTGASGTEIAGIGAAAYGMLAAHHYVPVGKTCHVIGWGATCDLEVSLKLLGQQCPDGTNLVDTIVDLEKLYANAPAAATRINFERMYRGGVTVPEKTYLRVTAVPKSSSSTVVRGWFYFKET